MNSIKNFYNKIPFNQYKTVKQEVRSLKNINPCLEIPIMKYVDINKTSQILEVGSGSGWFLNGLNFHYGTSGIGIDINENAVWISNQVAKKTKINSKFYVEDIFDFNTNLKFDLIISYGVLHHTKNCELAIKKILHFLNDDGILIMGLYHYGRKNLLEYFNKIKQHKSINGVKKEFFNFEYKKYPKNKKLLNSIFYDQIYNPFETCHSLLKISSILSNLGYKIVGASVSNDYTAFYQGDWNSVDNDFTNIIKNDIDNKIMNPGFFTVAIKKIDNNGSLV